MLYMPRDGHLWDTSIICHKDQYYLFSMFRFFDGDERYVWCAVSDDGVHFRDVGTVITDEQPVWKMFVHKCADIFVMNYGSLSGRPGYGNDTLKFYVSEDLLHWTELKNESSSHPDPRWYRGEERWDHMYTVEYNGKYYGYVVATAKTELGTCGCGMMESDDGIHWRTLPPVKISWGNREPVNFEVGGCEKIGGKFYLIGGTFCHHGNGGYAVFTFEADTPLGPFSPLVNGYRLCGSSLADEHRGVQWLASFGRDLSGEVILTNYITAQHSPVTNFIGTKENVWLTPIKKAVVDGKGILRMAWWQNNECLKGTRIAGREIRNALFQVSADTLTSEIGRSEKTYQLVNSITENGVVIEGFACVTSDGHFNPAKFGFAFQAKDGFRTITVQAGNPDYTHAEIVDYQKIGQLQCRVVDVIEPTTAGKTNIIPGKQFSFRLLFRKDIFELYVDDILVQTYLSLDQTRAIYLYLENAKAESGYVHIYEMTL